MDRAGGAPRRTFKPAPAAGLQLPAAAGLQRDYGRTTAPGVPGRTRALPLAQARCGAGRR